jgi:hypothetical protein
VIVAVVLSGLVAWEILAVAWPDLWRVGGPGEATAERSAVGRLWSIFPRSESLLRLGLILAGAAPALLYEVWVTHSHPALAAWNRQNLTPSPPWWDLLLAFSPALWLALPGASGADAGREGRRVLLVWAFLGMILIYLPFGLQRRFMFGLFVPLAGLAALGWARLAARWPAWATAPLAAFCLLALPTSALVLSFGAAGVQARDPLLYLRRDEVQALAWLRANSPARALVLASPEMGLFIPAWTGLRVVYGHPFETIQAERHEDLVREFYTAGSVEGRPQVLEGVTYILMGPRERALGQVEPDPGWRVVFRAGEVTVYEAANQRVGDWR